MMKASDSCFGVNLREEHRIIRVRQKNSSTVLGLVIWGALTGFCLFLLFGLCIGFFLSLQRQPESSVLVLSGVFLAGCFTFYAVAALNNLWCEFRNKPIPRWITRFGRVPEWLFVCYVGLCASGVWLLEGGSIFILITGILITLAGIVGTARRFLEPEPEPVCSCEGEEEADPMPWLLRKWADEYAQNPDDVKRRQQLLANLSDASQWLRAETEPTEKASDEESSSADFGSPPGGES
jgi:hypothetical protein